MTGKIKWFNQKDGYGFIVPDKGGPDVFMHIKKVEQSGLIPEQLKEGASISYVIREFRGKDQAEELVLAA